MKKISALVFATAFVFLAPKAFARDAEGATPSIQFDDFKTRVDGTQFNVSVPFKGDFTTMDLQAEYLGDAMQIEIPGAMFAKGKHLLRTNGKVVKSVYVSQPDDGTVRLRVTLNPGYRGSELADSLKITHADGLFNLSFNAGIEKLVVAPENEKTSQTLSFDDVGSVNPVAKEVVKDEIIEQARLVARDADSPASKTAATAKNSGDSESTPLNADTAVLGTDASDKTPEKITDVKTADAKTADATTALSANEASKKLSENEIPLAVEKESKKSGSVPWQRIVLTLGVMTMMGIGASFGMKKWSQSARSKVAKNARIKILTQHHLGPKKQLMIVEVAGESMLIGVTDHSISMLKSLSLIDDEIPEALPRSFEGAMDDNFIEASNQRNQPARLSSAQKDARAQQTLAAAQAENEADEEGENFALHGLSEIRDKVSTRLKNMRSL